MSDEIEVWILYSIGRDRGVINPISLFPQIHNIKTLQEIFNITVTEARNTYNYYQKDLNAAIQGLSSTSEVRQGPENRHGMAVGSSRRRVGVVYKHNVYTQC